MCDTNHYKRPSKNFLDLQIILPQFYWQVKELSESSPNLFHWCYRDKAEFMQVDPVRYVAFLYYNIIHHI